MSFIKKHGINIGIIAAYSLFTGYSCYSGYLPGIDIFQGNFKIFAKELITMLLLMTR